MSRRPALGVISTNNYSTNNTNKLNLNKQQANLQKQSIKVNNENEPPEFAAASFYSNKAAIKSSNSGTNLASASSNAAAAAAAAAFDFEIFQEESVDFKLQLNPSYQQSQNLMAAQKSKKNENNKLKEVGLNSNNQQTESVLLKIANKLNDKENLSTKTTMKQSHSCVSISNDLEFSNKENQSKQSEFYQAHENICYSHEDEEEEEEDEQEDDDDDDEEDEDEDDDDDDGDDNNELEEEGISRLNLAAIVDNTNSLDSKSASSRCNNDSGDLINMMDSTCSSSLHNDLSPMVLDDTIKFQTDNDEDDEDEINVLDDCDEDSEEMRRKHEIEERENLLMNCLEYKDDILKYMREMELQNRPKSNYLKKQEDITSSMRSILVDWLVEVSEEYKLNMETLYLAVNYTDRFLSQMSVLRGKLQLVGTASMYIASKYEEITPPDVSEFVYITDDTYTKKQVLRMEHLLLKVLDFRMNTPTANNFLLHYLRFLKLNNSSANGSVNTTGCISTSDLHKRIEHLARYLTELTLIDAETFLCYLPSQIAASAVYLALYTLGRTWTKQIAEQIGYSHDLEDLKPCIQDMLKCMQQAGDHPQQAIQEKYKQSKYDYVALIEPPKSLPFTVNPTK